MCFVHVYWLIYFCDLLDDGCMFIDNWVVQNNLDTPL